MLGAFYACISGVEAHFGYMSNAFDSGRNGKHFQSLTRAWRLAHRLQNDGHEEPLEESEVAMPLKPNGALCRVREQIIEDPASGLVLQFECDDGRLRLVIAGRAMSLGNREILFDQEGREAAAGTLVGEFRRPNWLKGVR